MYVCLLTGGNNHSKQDVDNDDVDAGQQLGSTTVPEKTAVARSLVREADTVLDELVKLREWQKEMETT